MDNKVIETLKKTDIHHKWIKTYRTKETNQFYELVFNYIINVIRVPKDALFLDAGCGTCAHSMRLVKRGYKVLGIDISEDVLGMAENTIKAQNLHGSIKLVNCDIVSLPFRDDGFDNILCWGVLMHIPNIEIAISELVRVMRPGGILVVSEANMGSLQSMVLRKFEYRNYRQTYTGLEYWDEIAGGIILSRITNIHWLIKFFESEGLVLKRRLAGQFTELYTRIHKRKVRALIHILNNFWFNCLKIPYLAFGNILIFQKHQDEIMK